MPFDGSYEDLIPALKRDPEGTIEQLTVFAWEWLEINCVALRWTPAYRITLAEVFGVDADSPAADIQAARAHFAAHPNDLKVAEMRDQGTHGQVDYTIVRTPAEVNSFDTSIADQMAPTFWDWFGMYAIRLLADAIDRRVTNILNSMPGRIVHKDFSGLDLNPEIMRQTAMAELSNPAMWLVHRTAAARISPYDLNSANMGSPVIVMGFDDSNVFSPDTCVVRDEQSGVHVLVADSLSITASILSDSRVDFGLDIWGGMGVDISTGKAKGVVFDLGIKTGV